VVRVSKKRDKSKEVLKYYKDNYASTATKAAQNLTFMADSLKKNPYPE
jgi:hypothetical protein